MAWQANIAKFAAVITCLVGIVVGIASLTITKDPVGPNGDATANVGWAAVWIVRIAVGTLLLVVAGLFYEREVFAEKLPPLPHRGRKRDLVFTFAILMPIVVPVVHLLYWVTVLLLGLWFLLTRLADPMSRLRGIAAYDGLLCIGLSLLMVHAGPTDAYGATRILCSIYAAAGGTFFPCLIFLASSIYTPRFARAACLSYAFAALHAAAVVMQAVGSYVYQVIDGISPIYTSEQCWPSMNSFLGMFMTSSAEAFENSYSSGSAGGGSANSLPFCPVVDLRVAVQPCDPLKWYLVLSGALFGLWMGCVVILAFFWKQPTRVVPTNESTPRQDDSTSPPSKFVMAVVLILWAGGMGYPGVLVFWKCPDEGWVADAPLGPIWQNTSSTTTSTTLTSTTITTTTTSTITTTWSTTTITTTFTGTTQESSGTNHTLENYSGGILPTMSPTPGLACVAAPSTTPIPLPRLGCRCGESPDNILVVWTEAPVEQLASLWCDVGHAAPVTIYTLLFFVHCYVFSLMHSQLDQYAEKERQAALRAKQKRLKEFAAKRQVSIGDAMKVEARPKITFWEESDRDPLPVPVAELGEERLFNV